MRERGPAARPELGQGLFLKRVREPLNGFEQREAFLENHGLHRKDGMEQERSRGPGGIHNRPVGKGAQPELGQ